MGVESLVGCSHTHALGAAPPTHAAAFAHMVQAAVHQQDEEEDDDDIAEDRYSWTSSSDGAMPPVVRLHCKTCHALVSDRGMRVFLVADVETSLFSTDIPSVEAVHEGSQKVIETCDCYARCVHCSTCEAAVGYHVLRPCSICATAEHNGHFWLFDASGVSSVERGILWDELPYNGSGGTDGATVDDVLEGVAEGVCDGSVAEGIVDRTSTSGAQDVGGDVDSATQHRGGDGSEGSGGAAADSVDARHSTLTVSNEEHGDAEENTCAVCAAYPMWRPTRVPCGHVFCFGCISREVDMRGACPLDRRPCTREQLQAARVTSPHSQPPSTRRRARSREDNASASRRVLDVGGNAAGGNHGDGDDD